MFIRYKIIVNILNNQIFIYACKEFDIKCEICNEWHLQITGIHICTYFELWLYNLDSTYLSLSKWNTVHILISRVLPKIKKNCWKDTRGSKHYGMKKPHFICLCKTRNESHRIAWVRKRVLIRSFFYIGPVYRRASPMNLWNIHFIQY